MTQTQLERAIHRNAIQMYLLLKRIVKGLDDPKRYAKNLTEAIEGESEYE